jgi:proton-translocating NADH-quinone oxidoreductase chain N
METTLLKSFLPEVFFSLSILIQLLFNTKIVNFSKFNFPIIDKEINCQTSFILVCVIFLFFNLNIEGFFSNNLFLNNDGTKFLKIITVVITFFCLSAIYKSFSIQNLNFFEFYSLFLFSLLSLLFLISSCDFLSIYLSIEMQTLCFYVLATIKRNSTFSTEAGLKYFISGSFFSGVFLFGISILYGSLGTLNIYHLNLLLSYMINSFDVEIGIRYIIDISIICIFTTLLFKIGCAPFHFWVPDVYEGAPLSSTIIVSVIPKIAIFYTFLELSLQVIIFL